MGQTYRSVSGSGSLGGTALTAVLALLAPSLAGAQRGTPPPPPDPPPQLAATFGFSYSRQARGCNPMGCGDDSQTRRIEGSATLYAVDGGYSGTGTGRNEEVADRRLTVSSPRCSQGESGHAVTAGAVEILVNAQFSINNAVTGGLDTSAMPADTSVVEVIVTGENLAYTSESQSCGVPANLSHNNAQVLFDCHFYGVDLATGGSYRAFKNGEDDSSGTCTLDIGGAATKLRIEGLVTGAFGQGGQTPLPESRVAVGRLEMGDDPELLIPLEPLSASQPAYVELAAADQNARYEIELSEPGGLPRLLVVSTLWYGGPPEFAVTSARAADGRYIPAYQALCVDDVDGSPCLKWRHAGGGEYVANVDFVHGSDAKLAENQLVVSPEAWDGTRTTAQNLAYAAYNYYHTHRAMKYFETLGLRVPWDRLMIRVHHSGSDCDNGAYYDAPAVVNRKYPAFGGLGAPLVGVRAEGAGVYICAQYNFTVTPPTSPLWHEVGHYLQWQMYDAYGGRGKPHEGYQNDDTNDSLIEGFATFVAMLVNEYYGARPASVIDGANFELDYKVWGLAGVWGAENAAGAEEEAVTSLLWDFHDRGREINLGQRINGALVSVSKVYPVSTDDAEVDAARILTVMDRNEVRDLVDLHNAFANTLTISRNGLDMLYVNHGMFADVVERNYVHDSVQETIGQTGSASNPPRLVRRSPKPDVPGAYLVSETDAAYLITVAFDEPYASYSYAYRVVLEAGVRTYFEMPPPYYPATATLTPLDENDTPLAGGITVSGDDFWAYVRSGPPADGVFRTLSR